MSYSLFQSNRCAVLLGRLLIVTMGSSTRVISEPTNFAVGGFVLTALALRSSRKSFRVVGRDNRRAGGLFGLSRGYAWLLPSLIVACLASAGTLGFGPVVTAAPMFTNVTASLGVAHLQATSTDVETMTGGVVAADFDGDGLVDLFFTRADAADILYRNTGSGFEDVSAAAGFADIQMTSGAAAGDIDNDGDLDLVVLGAQSTRHWLYINDGSGQFTEEAIARGTDISVGSGSLNRKGQGVAFGDYDGDGYLDMMTSDHSRPMDSNGSRLLRNLGAANPGHFEDVTQAAGLNVFRTPLAVTNPPNTYRFQPQFSDLDRDGHPDLVISSDSRTSQLFWNNGDGTFTDGTLAAGVGTDKSGMGTTLGDYDGDGDLDWLVTAIFDTTFLGTNPGNRLYRNNGNRTFTDVTTAAGVRNSGAGQELSWGWGSTFFDYDNDSDLDLAMTNGFVALGFGGDHTSLRINNGNGTFTEMTSASGITDTGQGRGLIHVDYDNDGDLDIVLANFGAAPIIYRNDGGNERSWLRVATEGTISNRDGIGAFVKVVPNLDLPDEFQVWEIRSGDSYLSQSELTAHFGLGELSGTIDLIEVHWPTSGLFQRFVEVPVNSTLIAQERLLGDFNGDSVVDAADYTLWRDTAGATGNDLQADGMGANGLPDGVVDQLDYLTWKANFGLAYGVGGASGRAATTVPEPANIAWLTALGMVVCVRQTGRRSRTSKNGNGEIA